jgi:hypothetical protein
MYPYWWIFHAGIVLSSSTLLLQVLTALLGDVAEAAVPELALTGLVLPELCGFAIGLNVAEFDSLTLLAPRPLTYEDGAVYPP